MFKEIAEYLMKNKKWWLIPPIILFIIFALLIAFSTTSPISPFIYMLV
ncbi:MAG: hypothetical protein UT13_C0001G0107 [Candidatus Pacebacteria bacterium GW2011_GWF2_38_9]|nr:MAG: hypothetical protein US01_C0001G0106 [candidate division TM6 bacterium GW2011_GWF2_28_16]KKQ09551.1 MAG: hypothetical protein US20_C0006G0004 [Candidatus Pacebacteria bacterium GW2011_GWF1_36_5]KKQ88461.1 MAG: hypothetical protein UT13_C0001G0107 [Candidatus Pacebacteria bacterium GW2011_GWF2_38_9]